MSIIKDLKKQITKLNAEISEIQAVTKKHGASTGNYDPSADCYWTEFTCNLCEKQWTEDGSK